MVTGMLAVRNLVLGEKNDLWNVNTDQEYHEEIRDGGVEVSPVTEVLKESLSLAFPKLESVAFGISLGTASSILLFVATILLLLKGGSDVGQNLGLLNQYFPGYTVTPSGSMLGLGYGFLSGFVCGWGFAFLRNTAVFAYMAIIHRRAEWSILWELLKYV